MFNVAQLPGLLLNASHVRGMPVGEVQS
ncbi:leu operon leader peptide [Dickeya dianthicola]|uniref:Leu operon attenuator peptide n=1 Tax=Dickeya dianthicola TaxID=204039 RepID=A0AAP2GAQ1_9GAMM|nr:leu operon leader peptide [Dickeya dianthicola]MBI0450557.1 leu operon leader peptide [Dickeya dianthicola]MBI0453975.1 leu operon leader peptide [Dickeya dianthicola]MBI0459286.1 leu operon leader peptide [Dickeya dianthicola]MBI0461257.1 leu operon leader peptide [Dickeya dianthicola]